jgi:hypothetical protein
MMSEPMTFREWCELNGRLHTGARTYEEFEKNAKDYEKYRGFVPREESSDE